MNHLKRAQEVFEIEIGALQAVQARLGKSFSSAVKTVVETLKQRGKIVIVGIGKSGNVGQKIAATLTSTGSTSVVLHSVDALHGDLGIINDGDLILAMSYSGETEEMLQLLPAIKRFDVKIISMTGAADSTLGRHSDVVLDVAVSKEACPFNLAPTSSTTVMLVLGDALAMAVLEARGFKKSDFAKHHPSGAIGRAMLVKLKDVMRSGTRNAVVKKTVTVRDALLEMTRAKSGIVSVVDGRGKLAGVFTDGDLRRLLAVGTEKLDEPIGNFVSPNPISLPESALAAEALKLFDTRNIDDLVVVDEKQRPVGILDLQDVPKLKLL